MRKACLWEELAVEKSTRKNGEAPVGRHLLLPLVAFRTQPGLSVLPLQPSREATSVPEGAPTSAQRRATDGTPVIQSEQMALLPRGIGVAAAPVPHSCQRLRPGRPSESC